MRDLFFQILAGCLGVWIATQWINGVTLQGPFYVIIAAGVILGLINFFIKPILNFITLPLKFLTFGLSSLIINMIMIWLVLDVCFPNSLLEISGIKPLFFTTLIIWGLTYIFSLGKK
ncbi:phage holin family protein [bacterium]|nr:phage holin family protein [bacterium]